MWHAKSVAEVDATVIHLKGSDILVTTVFKKNTLLVAATKRLTSF